MVTKNSELLERINFKEIMPLPREAGGHDEQMCKLFKDAKLIAHFNSGDYQGIVATIVELEDTKEIVMYSDYYGSCSGCDAWEDATNDDVIRMCKQLASIAKVFPNLEDAITFLKTDRAIGEDMDFDDEVREGLLELLGVNMED